MEWRWHKYRLLLETESSFFLYNLLNKAAIRIGKDTLSAAELHGDFTPAKCDSLNADLQRLSFVLPRSMTDEQLLTHWHDSLCNNTNAFEWLLLLTTQCNFACGYCFQEAEPTFRNVTTTCWPDIVQWLTGAILERRPRYVRVAFFGGEPLTQIGLLEEISSALRKACDAVGAVWRCDLVTNGYLLDDAVCQRLVTSGVRRVQITLDGPPAIHDARRPLNVSHQATFDKVLRAIEVSSRHEQIECIVRTNIDAHNCQYYSALLDILASRRLVRRVSVSIVHTQPAPHTSWDWNRFCFSRSEAPKRLAVCIGEAVRRGFRAFVRSLESGPCISMTQGGLVIEPNGNLSKCHHLASDPTFVLGNIRAGAALSVLDTVLPSPWQKCIDCPYVPICMGGCRYEAVQLRGEVGARVCGVRQYLAAVVPAYLSQFIPKEYRHEREELLRQFV